MFLDLSLAVLATLHGVAAHAFACLFLAAAGIGAPISQDVLLLAAGALSRTGTFHPIAPMLVAWVGVMAGDLLTLWTGHHFGARWVRRPWAARVVPPGRLPALEQGMRRHGLLLAFVTRFLPGQRASLYFIAGTLRMPWRSFLMGDGIAAAVQVPLFVVGARSLGWSWQALRAPVDRADDVLTLALVIVLMVWWLRARRSAAAR